MLLQKITFIVALIVRVKSDNEYEKNIKFYVWNGNGSSIESNWQNNQSLLNFCGPTVGNFTIIVHGWRESVAAPWTSGIVTNFLAVRGGCVFFMDYS